MFKLLYLAEKFMDAISKVSDWFQTSPGVLTFVDPTGIIIDYDLSGLSVAELLIGSGLVAVLGIRIWRFCSDCIGL